jgi:UDP-N-acetylmuramoyl-tripeptide--D-alanyl-D-alanine ligase
MWSVDRLLTWGKEHGAEIVGNLENRAISGFSINTQTLSAGTVFICLKGTQQDGHYFVEEAFDKGAAGVMVSRAWFSEQKNKGKNKRQQNLFDPHLMIVVEDPLSSLQSLAGWHRRSFQCPIIGITGTNGKTTTKEMLSKILIRRGPVLKTEGNLNNHIGLPLTLLRLQKEDQAAVLEMGISRPGDMRLLCEIAKPTMGIITNIGQAHLEWLGNIEGVAAEKKILFDSMAEGSIVVINGDDPLLQWDGKASEKWTYAIENEADLTATEIEQHDHKMSFTLALNKNQKGGGGKMKVILPLLGTHQVYNAMAASTGALALGYEFDEIRSALKDFSAIALRGEVIKWNGATILLDAYNANPSSMKSALKTLAEYVDVTEGHRKVAVLGDMLELGSMAKSAHKGLGRQVAQSGIDRLIVVGQFSEIVACGAVGEGLRKEAVSVYKNVASLNLAHEIQEGDVVLIKGSRGMKMEQLLDSLYKVGALTH